MKYDSQRDARLYLNNGVFLHGRNIVRVREVEEDMTVIVDVLNKQQMGRVPIKEISMKPLTIGYYYSQSNDKCVYLVRLPMRGWRQGLTSGNCRAKNVSAFGLDIHEPNFHKMIWNEYPSVQEAKDYAKKVRDCYPFHRAWAIDRYGKLYYKTEVVGEMDGTEYHLFKTFHFLKELLEEALGNDSFKTCSC